MDLPNKCRGRNVAMELLYSVMSLSLVPERIKSGMRSLFKSISYAISVGAQVKASHWSVLGCPGWGVPTYRSEKLSLAISFELFNVHS
jgi:hypothetical protein